MKLLLLSFALLFASIYTVDAQSVPFTPPNPISKASYQVIWTSNPFGDIQPPAATPATAPVAQPKASFIEGYYFTGHASLLGEDLVTLVSPEKGEMLHVSQSDVRNGIKVIEVRHTDTPDKMVAILSKGIEQAEIPFTRDPPLTSPKPARRPSSLPSSRRLPIQPPVRSSR